jgi:hypothetical protein
LGCECCEKSTLQNSHGNFGMAGVDVTAVSDLLLRAPTLNPSYASQRFSLRSKHMSPGLQPRVDPGSNAG